MKRMPIAEYFKFKNVRDYVQGTYNHFFKEDIKTHIREQAMYRASLCNKCLINGSCMHCGCSTPGVFFAPNKVDANNKWGAMLGEKNWELYKVENNIDISVITKEVEDAIKINNKITEDMLKANPALEHYPNTEYSDDLKELIGNEEEDKDKSTT